MRTYIAKGSGENGVIKSGLEGGCVYARGLGKRIYDRTGYALEELTNNEAS